MKIKELLFNLLLLFLIGVMTLSYFDHYSIQSMYVDRKIEEYENIKQEEKTDDNFICLIMKSISETIVSIIQFIVLIFSNIISSIGSVMV